MQIMPIKLFLVYLIKSTFKTQHRNRKGCHNKFIDTQTGISDENLLLTQSGIALPTGNGTALALVQSNTT